MKIFLFRDKNICRFSLIGAVFALCGSVIADDPPPVSTGYCEQELTQSNCEWATKNIRGALCEWQPDSSMTYKGYCFYNGFSSCSSGDYKSKNVCEHINERCFWDDKD